MKLSLEILDRLQSRYAELEQADQRGLRMDSGIWTYLQSSEHQLIGLMTDNPPAPDAAGSMEFSWALYFLNHLIAPWVTDLLRKWGMPESKIKAEDWAQWDAKLSGQGVLYGNGSLVSYSQYALLDAGWSLALFDYILLWLNIKTRHPFGTTPKTLNVPVQSNLRIALFGDWGTGNYQDGNLPKSPSQLIADQIAAQEPHISIHLGDVYYSGTTDEEQEKLLTCWPKGSLGNFTLNSNHEMYDGANGYFGKGLANNLFKGQQGTSYFQIEFGNWLILGLDTAYYDTSWLFSHGAILDAAQVAFLRNAAASEKKIMLLTHHNPIDITGTIKNNLLTQVLGAMGTVAPDYWYWGHEHNGVIYTSGGITGKTLCRCLGNSGIPIGKASWLAANSNVTAYTNKGLANPTLQQNLRVMNAYAILDFSADAVTERWFYQDGSPFMF